MRADVTVKVDPVMLYSCLVLTEDHTTSTGLQHTRHGDANILVDVIPTAFDDDHRTIVEITHTCPCSSPGLTMRTSKCSPGK